MIKRIVFVILLCTSVLIQAQEPVSVHLSEKDGLPDKEFYNIIEDSKGFIWLCADKGLFRYDGKNFKDYSSEKQRGLAVFGVQEDHLGRVWCNNTSGQFFHIQDNKLQLFIDLGEELNGELADFIVDKESLWVFSIKKVCKINLATKRIEQNYSEKINYGVPIKLKDTIYFQRLDSISSINDNNKIKGLVATNLKLNDKKGKQILKGKSRLFKLGSSMFLMQNRSNTTTFFQFNLSNKTFNKLTGLEALANESVYMAFEKSNNEVWLATSSGVWVYKFKDERFQFRKRFLKDKNVTKIIEDKDGTFWFITLNNGIFIMPNLFIDACTISEDTKAIRCLEKVNDSTLVFGTNTGSISFYNTLTNTEKIIDIPSKDRVSALKFHPKKNTLFISKDFNSFILNYKTSYLEKVEGFDNTKSFSLLNGIDLLYTNYNGAFLVKDANFNTKTVRVSNKKRTYASFYNQTDKTVYVAFVDNLIRYDSLWNPKIISHKNKPIYGKSIAKTNNGIVWISTFKDGVYGVKNDSVIHHYTTANGLTSNNTVKIKADQDKVWIASSNSIQTLDVNTKKFKTLTKTDGIVSYDISGIEVMKDKIFFSYGEGLFSVDKESAFKDQSAEVYFNALEINEKDTLITSSYKLKYDQNAIKIGFNVNGFLFNQKGKYKYRLKGLNNTWSTTAIGVNSVKYNSLPAGKYSFQVYPVLENQKSTSNIKELQFLIRKPFWQRLWFVFGVSVLILGLIFLYFRTILQKKERERIKLLEKISLEKEISTINLTALRSQMNPHFIFNALNSIQDLILKQDTDASYDYIVLFAELIRNTLSYSNQDFIPIEKELEFLKVYLQLEQLRFGDAFSYTIQFEGKENLEVPSLLIQPFIENALVHGLLHKSGKKELSVLFKYSNVLQCIIIDNGIGRKKAESISKRQGSQHKSFALSAIEKRLEILKKQYDDTIGYTIEDQYINDIAKGTKVILTMPFKKRF